MDFAPSRSDAIALEPRAAPAYRVTFALLALVALNTALSFKNWWPTPGILPDHRLAPEFVALWVVLLIVVAWRGALSRG